MQIYKQETKNFKYAFNFPYNHSVLAFLQGLKAKVGRGQLNFQQGCWRFNDLNILTAITRAYPQTTVHMNMQDDIERFELDQKRLKLRLEKAERLKAATNSDINIVGVKGELRPYQKVGVEFFINNDGKAILADTMGLGKTLQTIAYMTHTKQRKTLVISPSSVKYVWEAEVKKWSSLSPLVIEGSDSLSPLVHSAHDVFIVNYDIVKKFFNEIKALHWDLLVCDEFHYIKNSSAQRTKFVKAIADSIPRVLLLSGTPLLSRPVELFNGLNLMDPAKWNDYYAFTKRYCDGKTGYFGGWEAKGATNIDELQQRISQYFLRRRKEDVLKELPPKTFIDVPVKMKSEYQSAYREIIEDFHAYMTKKKGVYEDEGTNATKLVQLNELRQITTAAKYDTALEMVSDVVENGEKIVVFSVYNAPLLKMKEVFGDKAVLLIGSTDKEERKGIVEKFQKSKKIQVFLGGIKSAGVGLTLTAASKVLFIDYSWVPADHDQAADRIHRIGQTADNVTIYQLYTRGTIDAYMQELLAAKKEVFKKLIDEGGGTASIKDNFINDLLSLIERDKKAAEVKKSPKKRT